MELFKKIILFLGNVLKFIGQFPAFLLPTSLRGYRTILINVIAAIAAILNGFDIVPISESICGLFNCNPAAIQAFFAFVLSAININLRFKTTKAVPESK